MLILETERLDGEFDEHDATRKKMEPMSQSRNIKDAIICPDLNACKNKYKKTTVATKQTIEIDNIIAFI